MAMVGSTLSPAPSISLLTGVSDHAAMSWLPHPTPPHPIFSSHISYIQINGITTQVAAGVPVIAKTPITVVSPATTPGIADALISDGTLAAQTADIISVLASTASASMPVQSTATLATPIAAAVVNEELACFGDYNTRYALEWKAVTLTQHKVLSYVYKHVSKVGLKSGVLDSILYKSSPKNRLNSVQYFF